MGYWNGKDHFRVVLIREIDLDRLARKTGMPVSTSRQRDVCVEKAIDMLCGEKVDRDQTPPRRGRVMEFASDDELQDEGVA